MRPLLIAVIVVVVIAAGVAAYLLPSILPTVKPPSPMVMLSRWSEATYTANYTMIYGGNINVFGIVGVSSTIVGSSITWSQGTLNRVLIQLSLSNSTYLLLAIKNLGGGMYHLCTALSSGVTLSYCQNVNQSQVPLLGALSPSSMVFKSKVTVNGILSYCYMSLVSSGVQSYNVTLCIAPNGVLTMANITKHTPTGYYNIMLTLNNFSINQFLSNRFNEIAGAAS